MRETVITRIHETKIIAIVRGIDEQYMLPLGEAFIAGGIRLMEVAFNPAQPEEVAATARSIAAVRERFGAELLCGAGTVITPALVDRAAGAGALFIVSPNTDPEVIRRTREKGLVSLPGALTPSECLSAHNAGADFIKLFPAADLGPGYLKAIRSPLSHLHFIAVGGITAQNIADFLNAGAVGFGIGGNLVNPEWIETGRFALITGLAQKMTALCRIL